MRGDPGVALTLLISRSFKLSAAAVGPVGLWATLLCCPQIHRLAGAEDFGPAQPARHAVRTCRIGEAGTAPTSTAKSRIDAVPHTVLSTHAGAVFQSLPNASMCAVARGGDDCPTVSVRALPNSGAGLQPLRPWPDLLRTRLCTDGSARRPARAARYQASRRGRVNHAVAGRSLSRHRVVGHFCCSPSLFSWFTIPMTPWLPGCRCTWRTSTVCRLPRRWRSKVRSRSACSLSSLSA